MEPKPNYFIRVLIIGFILFLSFLVVVSFNYSETNFNLSAGIITVLLLITVLILSEAFDNLSLGKLLSLSRTVKNKDEEIIKTKKENNDLRDNLIKLSSTFSQLQTLNQSTTNNNMLFTPDSLRKMLGVEKAEENENEQDEETIEDKKIDQSEPQSKSVNSPNIEPKKTIDYRLIEEIAINKFTEKHKIPKLEIVREVQFASSFANIDPIMERKIIFDGYYKSQDIENFIEVKRVSNPMIYDRLYVQLAKIMFYGKAKKIDAFLTLLLLDLPETLDQYTVNRPYRNVNQKMFEAFQPAIANNLLRIEIISITEDDIEKEALKEVAADISKE